MHGKGRLVASGGTNKLRASGYVLYCFVSRSLSLSPMVGHSAEIV